MRHQEGTHTAPLRMDAYRQDRTDHHTERGTEVKLRTVRRTATEGTIVCVTDPATGKGAEGTVKWVSPTEGMFTVKLHDESRTVVYAYSDRED